MRGSRSFEDMVGGSGGTSLDEVAEHVLVSILSKREKGEEFFAREVAPEGVSAVSFARRELTVAIQYGWLESRKTREAWVYWRTGAELEPMPLPPGVRVAPEHRCSNWACEGCKDDTEIN